jgi:selenide,water dikinase
MGTTERIRLTQLTSRGGCAAKWDPDELKNLLNFMPQAQTQHADILLGFETSDDAAIYRLRDDLAAVLTVDFFTPLVDDPYEFGRIAAANALSDVFAMGATPHAALNLLALDSTLGAEVAAEILRGGAETVNEAGAFIVGGHTIDDVEPKYGLSVFGTVHPKHVIKNQGALPGDALYLTKPLGTGIMSAAFKIGLETEAGIRTAIDSMMELNASAALAMRACGAHAATDVTGFGLAGHLHEMLAASGCTAVLDWESIPLFPGVWKHALLYCRPARCFALMDLAQNYVEQEAPDDEYADNRLAILCDPQTSGGLLIAVPPESHEAFERKYAELSGKPVARIGTIQEGTAGHILIR